MPITATPYRHGTASTARVPEFPGVEQFAGTTHHIGNWPHEPVVFTGLQVGVIGTGSSAIQAVPVIARQPAQLFMFQRTLNFSIPSQNQSMTEAYAQSWKQDYPALREKARGMRTATALSSGAFETSGRNGCSRAHSVTPNGARRPPPIRRPLASPVSTRLTAPSLDVPERWSKHRRCGVCGWSSPGGACDGAIDRQFSAVRAPYGLSGRRTPRRGSRKHSRTACPALGATRQFRWRQRRRWRRWWRHVAAGPSRNLRVGALCLACGARSSRSENRLGPVTQLPQSRRRGLTAFKLFGSFYYLTGAFANGVSAYDAASNGDPVTGGLDSTNAIGNVLLAGNASKNAIAGALPVLPNQVRR